MPINNPNSVENLTKILNDPNEPIGKRMRYVFIKTKWY